MIFEPSSMNSTWPAWITGMTLSSMTAMFSGSVRWPPVGDCQCSNSRREKMYLALGKVGTHLPSTSRVFQPTWSMCRCVQITSVTSSGWTPASARRSRYGRCSWWKRSKSGSARVLSLPQPVSIRIVWRSSRIIHECMLDMTFWLASSQKRVSASSWCSAKTSSL